MGKQSTQAPDPRLVDAQIRSMGYQDDAIQRIMANSDRLAPLQEQQMRFGLDASRLAQQQSQQDREWMLGRRGKLGGLQDRLVQDAESFNTEGRRNELAAEAGADVAQAFSNQRQQAARGLSRMGVNPNSGRSLAIGNQMDMAEASARASAANKTRQAARMEGLAMTDRATNALAGYPAMGMQATAAGAGFGSQGLNVVNSGLAGMNSGWGAASGAAGNMGQNATGMWNAQANSFNQGQAAEGQFWGSILGAGATLGAAKFSDRRLKKDIALVGTDERTGLNLYEFSYVDSDRRFRGVMADEVERVMPEAVMTASNGYKAVNYTMLDIEMVEV